MDIHGNMNMRENALQNVVFAIDTNFPADPKPGRFVFKDGVAYLCTEFENGLPVWVPITKARNMVVHKQEVPALEWTIAHGLNINTVFTQVYDENGQWILPDSINNSVMNQTTVGFSIPMVGTAILMRGETEGAVQALIAHEQSFVNQSVWVVTHGLGHDPIIRVIIGGKEVQPASIVYDNTMQATVTFSSPQSGSVRCI
jgi:hypothetical protein